MPGRAELVGKKYGMLTVVERRGKCKNGALWLCECECGNRIETYSSVLIEGQKYSCGCKRRGSEKYDIAGKTYGHLTAIKKAGIVMRGKRTYASWLCQCDCGNTKELTYSDIMKSRTKSCGCVARELSSMRHKRHGMTNTRIHHIWQSMLCRCNKGRKNYTDVAVCEEWKSFETFYEWAMENGYRDDLSIDRIDPYGNYEPSNCRWATNKQQQNNKRNNSYFVIDGVRHTMREWADIYEIEYYLVKGRISRGYSIERALTTPVFHGCKVKVIETGKVYNTYVECAKAMGLNPNAISKCVRGKCKSYKGYHFEQV